MRKLPLLLFAVVLIILVFVNAQVSDEPMESNKTLTEQVNIAQE